MITWRVERSGVPADDRNGFYSQAFDSVVGREGDLMRVLDVLVQQVGVIGVFSWWSAADSSYANCKGMRQAGECEGRSAASLVTGVSRWPTNILVPLDREVHAV